MNPSTTIPCPWCKAEAGAGCVDQYGNPFKAGIHIDRYYAQQEAQKA